MTDQAPAGYVQQLRALVGPRPLILAGACVIVLDGDGHVLLGRRTDTDDWDVIGGLMEPGERFEDTARREVREEVGLELGELVSFEIFSGPDYFFEYPNGDQVYYVGEAFVAREVRGTPVPDPAEVKELAYFDLDALPNPLNPTARRLLDRFRAVRFEPRGA